MSAERHRLGVEIFKLKDRRARPFFRIGSRSFQWSTYLLL